MHDYNRGKNVRKKMSDVKLSKIKNVRNKIAQYKLFFANLFGIENRINIQMKNMLYTNT